MNERLMFSNGSPLFEKGSRMELLRRNTGDNQNQDSKSQNILSQISILRTLSKEELQCKWREVFGREPPKYSRPFLLKRLIYKIQENAFGGLKSETKKKMDNLLAEGGFNELAMRNKSGNGKRSNTDLIPGTLLVREWQGRRHEVTVIPDGFEYCGKRYRSLTSAAKAITGTHWNGPIFFGIRRPGNEKAKNKS